ncbi:fructose symporter [Elasticomyces elasticus]|uniref:Fructose symporter n=1 Tax=Exophiala sideris TaxID=1016849 RepID=A0ABR0JAG4_9EURO|nr:fructose symporter [Elasticomyces elasticus]KAK5030368.1 fructose symporter [Exophiala sideris]KAK5038421.1 fructose symporter [Exophiala sideris]KAK5060304.1 fructose symporter [Exophiala sideris]KAK5183215.1 fructose symporter [Eurotiomycetes sp. CCFEE 6388]
MAAFATNGVKDSQGLDHYEHDKVTPRTMSMASRRLSQAEAMKLAVEDVIVDDEIAEFEAALQETPVKGTFLNPQISFSDPRHFTWLLVGFASMGGMLSGLDQSVISGALLYMPDDLHLSTSQISLTSSAVPLGAIGGALLLGPLNEAVGRKMAIIVALILYTIGGALEAGAINFGMIVGARVILGMGLGLEGGTVPVYVAESVEKKYRGNLVSLYQFMIAFGEVVGYVVAAIFVNVHSGSWRYMLGSSLVFSTIMLVGMIFMPESPRMLMHKGKTLEAFAVWKRIRGLAKPEDRKEFFIMHHALDSEVHEGDTKRKRFVWLDFFTNPRARRSIVYANIMIALGQLTGINAIMYYMSTLMSQIGFDRKQSVFMSLVGGGALLLGTIPGVLYMEKFGRRFWANTMLPCFFIGLVFVGVSYQLTSFKATEGLYLTGIILYNGFFGSYACLTWVIPSEVFPTYLRSYGMESTDVNLFFGSWLVTYFFSDMQRAMTKTGLTLGFYGGIAVLGLIYQVLFMPETKNKTLEEIDLIFSQPTSQLVAQNLRNTKEALSDVAHFRFRKVFAPVEQTTTGDGTPGNVQNQELKV